MFGSRASLKSLAVLCKSLATMLHSGVALLKALEIASKKTGDAGCRKRLVAVREEVQQGTDIARALREQRGYFPELMVDMVSVGEETGQLPEVLDGLADHYENVVRLRRLLIGMITWPAIQLVAAILLVAFVIFILGILAPGSKAIENLTLGFTGTAGALKWLGMSFGSIFAVLGGYWLIANVFRRKRFLDALLMKIPVLGTCMQSFAIARFSWAFSLTQQTGMPVTRSLELSFRATNNGAFVGASPLVGELVMNGEELGAALDRSRLFPDEYLSIVNVAETSGTVPEALARLAPTFEEQARRSLTALAVTLGWLVWLVVAGVIIFLIFRFFLWYAGMINSATQGNFDFLDK